MTLLMATISSPKILLLDEHTAALDPAMAEKVLEITRNITQMQGLTTMMITHNIHSALALGNRTIMMDAGRIVLDIQGKERSHITVDALLAMYRQKSGETLATDRILLTRR
jgi:putative ABC transport system ATP-binding protein